MNTNTIYGVHELFTVIAPLTPDYDVKVYALAEKTFEDKVTIVTARVDTEKREVVLYADVTIKQANAEMDKARMDVLSEYITEVKRLELEVTRLKEALNKEKDALDEKNAEIERAWKQYTEMYKTAHGESDRLKHENKVLQITLDALKKEAKEEVDNLRKSRAYWRDEYWLLKESIDGE